MFIFPLNAYSITIHLLCECVSGQLLCWLSSFDAGLGTRVQNCNKNPQGLQLISDFGNAFTRRKVLKVRKVIHNKKRPIRVLLRQPSSFFSPAAMSLHWNHSAGSLNTQLTLWLHSLASISLGSGLGSELLWHISWAFSFTCQSGIWDLGNTIICPCTFALRVLHEEIFTFQSWVDLHVSRFERNVLNASVNTTSRWSKCSFLMYIPPARLCSHSRH